MKPSEDDKHEVLSIFYGKEVFLNIFSKLIICDGDELGSDLYMMLFVRR